tara:strand:+ start:298 stop:666 length:369 start_codon:yes stop_codon:yes gene_type:complete
MEEKGNYDREEIFSKSIRAGRRTYFFDVRSTRAEDYYMTITESKKFSNEDGSAHYKKHKIYLYKEDFEEFATTFKEISDFIFDKKGKEVISNYDNTSNRDVKTPDSSSVEDKDFSDIKIEDI